MIREKSRQERTAMQFASAGLGARSAAEAARLMLKSGISFETAAVLGQRMDEPCTATPATIQEAAWRFRRLQEGALTSSAWGRPIKEASATDTASLAPAASETSTQFVHKETTVNIDGVPHYEVVEYEPVTSDLVSEEAGRTPWGRKVEG